MKKSLFSLILFILFLTIQIYSSNVYQSLQILSQPGRGILGIDITDDDKTLVVGDFNRDTHIYKKQEDKFGLSQSKLCQAQVQAVDITGDGQWIHSICSDSKLYKKESDAYIDFQQMNYDSSYAKAGAISDDKEIVAIGKSNGNVQIYIYNSTNQNYTYSHRLIIDDTISYISISKHHKILVVSTLGYKVSVYRYQDSKYTLNHTITYPFEHLRRATLSQDNEYLVINNQYQNFKYNTEIYEYNQDSAKYQLITKQDTFHVQGYAYFASLSPNKQYLAISTSQGIQIFSNPFASVPTLQQTLQRSRYHKFSPTGKYLITGISEVANVYIDCNWNTSGGYFLDSSGQCKLCQPYCLRCLNENKCQICDSSSTLKANGQCTSCNKSNCLSCQNSTHCGLCSTGYKLSGNYCVGSAGGIETQTQLTIFIIVLVFVVFAIVGIVVFCCIRNRKKNRIAVKRDEGIAYSTKVIHIVDVQSDQPRQS